jgi:hypothetical protein
MKNPVSVDKNKYELKQEAKALNLRIDQLYVEREHVLLEADDLSRDAFIGLTQKEVMAHPAYQQVRELRKEADDLFDLWQSTSDEYNKLMLEVNRFGMYELRGGSYRRAMGRRSIKSRMRTWGEREQKENGFRVVRSKR